MGKIIAFFMSVIVTLPIFFQCLFGIGGLEFGKVVLVLEKDAYPVGTEMVTAVLYNCTRERIPYAPYYYSLERRENGEWVRIALDASVFIPLATVLIDPFHSTIRPFRLTDHGALPAGQYRVQASNSAYVEFELTS